MAEKKKKNAEKTDKAPIPKRNGARTSEKSTPKEPVEALPRSAKFIHQFAPYILTVGAIFLLACFCLAKVDGAMGIVGKLLRDFFCGLFGWPAFTIPLILLNLAVYWRKYVDMGMVPMKLLLSVAALAVLAALVHLVTLPAIYEDSYNWKIYLASIFGTGGTAANWTLGIGLTGGGFIGGLIGGAFRCLVGFVGSLILLVAMLVICFMFLFSVTPKYVITTVRYRIMLMQEKRAARRQALEKLDNERNCEIDERKNRLVKDELAALDEYANETNEAPRRKRRTSRKQRADAEDEAQNSGTATCPESGDEDDFTPEEPFVSGSIDFTEEPPNTAQTPPDANEEEPTAPASQKSTVSPLPTVTQAKNIDDHSALIENLFNTLGENKKAPAQQNAQPSDGEDMLEITMTPISDAPAAEDDDEVDPAADRKKRSEQLSVYVYPPTELLHEPETVSQEDVLTELRSNAQKLMAKLKAFNVNIKKIEYSRGPTITRYELYPETSTRVRSIANLSDDIALELAATVRIEAPIPNKNAVGVEVPNQTRATVFIRELLESEKFLSSSSKLTACLGKDVGGNMIFADLAKMPHLLIAGTTGSGKSVCMNCIILSLLYKARPDEVQFIMIDPKKIEMGMYNKLPHLKVPVVTDMKKAAGTLNAAVNEMEHRYELFEDVNARDLDGYNRAMRNENADFVPLPKIVIFIDELADLMMTAPTEIEQSIVRLAQKARAAGIHLILGTQRPSVSVITGLIKANIPSRIAFSVASQVDSRIIIDVAGAEKLIGKGDMLYAPIGAPKPTRVQGAFVADSDVERVTDYIKANSETVEYDDAFISEIERETERLTADKKGSDDDSYGDGPRQDADPAFTEALRIAVEHGTIATSFLQRKISVGFGRAAKIIDRMEALGLVSPQNGNKPRNVLITKQQLMEMEMNKDPRVYGNFD